VPAEILELLTRIAELERKLDSMFRHGPVHERRKIEGRWFVRLKIGGTDDEPFLSPWIPYSSPNGGPAGLNVHRVPAEGEQLTMLSPAGDFRQAVATSLFWSDDHPPPSEDEDAVTITHPKFRLDLKDGTLKIETSENVDIKSAQTIKLDAGQSIALTVGDSEIEIKGDAITIKAEDVTILKRVFVGMDDKNEKIPIKILTVAGPAKQAFSKVG
jgi:phage baseplate assembly protein gpV